MFVLRQLVESEPLSTEERERVNGIMKAVFDAASTLLVGVGHQTVEDAIESWRQFREVVEELGASISFEMPINVVIPTVYKPLWYNFVTGEMFYKEKK